MDNQTEYQITIGNHIIGADLSELGCVSLARKDGDDLFVEDQMSNPSELVTFMVKELDRLDKEVKIFRDANDEKNEFLQQLGISAGGEFNRIKYYVGKMQDRINELKDVNYKLETENYMLEQEGFAWSSNYYIAEECLKQIYRCNDCDDLSAVMAKSALDRLEVDYGQHD